VTDSKTKDINAITNLDNRIGNQIKSIPGVENVFPLVISGSNAKFSNGKSSGITLVGSQGPFFVGGPWRKYTAREATLLEEGGVITEYFDRDILGGITEGDFFEINGKRVRNVGLTKGIRSFQGASLAFTSIERARYLTGFPTNESSVFVVKVKPEYNEDTVIRYIDNEMNGVKAWSAEDLALASISSVIKTSGIATSFGTLIIFAVISGLVIIGLTLYSAAIDRIKDYGTLKAIGATNSYITRLILTQAALFSLAGFIIGYLLMEAFRVGMRQNGTYFTYTLWMQFLFLALTFIISLGGSLFAIRRINSLEPAQVFRG
jgi:putative ABC transport system permease protein